MDTQEIVLTHNSDDGLYTQLLRGRYVTSIDDGTITLDDGTELYIHGNEGGGGCESGWYWLENVYKQGSRRARIMSAYVAYGEDDEDAPSVYTLFVMVDSNPTQLPLATVRGNDGNGYYGTGFTLTATVKTRPAPPLTVAPRTSSRSSQASTHFLRSRTFEAAKPSSTPSPTRFSRREASTRPYASPDPKLSSSTS